MRYGVLTLVLGALVIPAIASAEDKPQPKYPLGFDCASVAAGSQRQACNQSHLDPPMGAIPEVKRAKPESFIPPPQPPIVPTGKPSTIPRLPGTIDPGN